MSLPGDREEDRERERSIGDQLNNIISHIEVKENAQIHKYKIAQNTQIYNTKVHVGITSRHVAYRGKRFSQIQKIPNTKRKKEDRS